MGCTSSIPVADLTTDDKLSHTYQRARLVQNLVQQTNKVDPLSRYDIISKIGVGSMGYVCTVQRKKKDIQFNSSNSNITQDTIDNNHMAVIDQQQQHLFAMKTLRAGRVTRGFIAELRNEIRCVRRLDHPNIVRFHEVYYQPSQISIIMDYCSGGDVYGRMPYTELQAASIMKQILEALAYMHRRGYVHLDIKCENVMFEGPGVDAKVKIIDFGFATRYDPSRGALHKQLGTFDTMAPEVYGGNYTTQADLWSAGVVAFELISGKKPFAASSAIGVIGKVANGEFKLNNKAWNGKSASSKTFVKDLIQKDPEQRLNAASALHHRWIRSHTDKKSSVSKNMRSIRDSMDHFSKAPTLKKIGLLMIAHKAFPEEISKLQKYFVQFDTGNTGVISLEEFGKAIKVLDDGYTREEIQKIFDSIDTYGNGEIAYTEFLAATLEKYVYLSEDRILDAFDRIDVTSSGYISIEDLRLVLGRDFTEERAKEIISQIDGDGDGKVSREEFISSFRQDKAKLETRLGIREIPSS